MVLEAAEVASSFEEDILHIVVVLGVVVYMKGAMIEWWEEAKDDQLRRLRAPTRDLFLLV